LAQLARPEGLEPST